MGISYIVVVLPRFTQGGCLGDTQKVTPKVALEGLLEALVGEKGGTKEMKTGDTSKQKSILVQGRIISNIPISVYHLRIRMF